METFSALLAICAVPGEFSAQRPVTRSFDVFFDLHPNKRLSKQWWGWWFETPSCPLWRHRNVNQHVNRQTICLTIDNKFDIGFLWASHDCKRADNIQAMKKKHIDNDETKCRLWGVWLLLRFHIFILPYISHLKYKVTSKGIQAMFTDDFTPVPIDQSWRIRWNASHGSKRNCIMTTQNKA